MIFIILFFIIVESIDITSSTCPAGFNITTANTTATSATYINNQAMTIYSSYITNTYKSTIRNIIIKGDINSLVAQLYQMAVPYLVVAIVVFILYCILIGCCVFDRSCPPCETWRRDKQKSPYQKAQLTASTSILMFLCFVIIVACTIAFSTVDDVKSALSNTKCSLYKVLDCALNGDSSNSWAGYLNISSQINNISNSLGTSSAAITQYFGINSYLINDIANIRQTNVNLYPKYNTSKLINTDPTTPNGSVISSVFIVSGLGPNGTTNTMITDLDSGISIAQKLSNAAYAVDQSALELNDSIILIQNNTQNLTQNLLSMYNQQLNNTISVLNSFTTIYIDNYAQWSLYILESIVGMALIAAMIAVLGAFSSYCFDIYNCRLVIHMSWLIFGLIYTGILVLAFIYIPMGSVGAEFCDFFNEVLHNQTSYQSFGLYYPQNVLTKIQVCLYGDGNILKTFDTLDQMNTVFSLFDNYNSYLDYTNSASTNYVDLSIANTKITNWITAMGKYRDGVYIDSYSTQLSDANPNYAMKSLNTYSKLKNTSTISGYTNMSNVNSENCTNDEWVFDITNCTSTNIYQPSINPSSGLNVNPAICWCFSLNSSLTSGGSAWSQSDFNQRYVSVKENCSSTYNKILSYGYRLIQYRDSRINLFSSIADDLSKLLANYTTYTNSLNTYFLNVSSFFNNISTLNTLVNDKTTGLLYNNNCTIIANNIRFVYNSFCVNFMGQAIKLALCVGILSGALFLAMIVGNVVAGRLSKIKINEEHQEINLSQKDKSSDDSFDDQLQ